MHTNNYGSREADKFVVRFPASVHAGLQNLARDHDRSFNSEIKQALEHWLDDEAPVRRMHTILIAMHSETSAAVAISTVPRVSTDDEHTRNYVTRFATGVHGKITDKAHEISISMNTLIVQATAWWVNTHLEMRALLKVTEAQPVLDHH